MLTLQAVFPQMPVETLEAAIASNINIEFAIDNILSGCEQDTIEAFESE